MQTYPMETGMGPDFYTGTEEGKKVFAALHYKGEGDQTASISLAVCSGHTMMSTAEARELGELLLFSADAIDNAEL